MSEHTRPPLKHPRGHCANVMQHRDDPLVTIRRLETAEQCRQWLIQLGEIDAADEYKQAVADRYEELRR